MSAIQHIAIIPARSGSKRIFNKNLQILGKRPLIQWSIDFATDNDFDKIILSTDIHPVDQFLNKKKIKFKKRTQDLSSDQSLMSDVVESCLKDEKIGKNDYIWILQPTSPFRKKNHFKKINEIIKKCNPSSIISVKYNTDRNRTYSMKPYHKKKEFFHLYPYKYTGFQNEQDLKDSWLRSGEFYVFKYFEFLKSKSFYIVPCIAFIVDENESVNIDYRIDLDTARSVEKRFKY